MKTLGSLFDGSGGFPLAATMNGIEPLWASEIEPFPIAVTKARFPHMEHLGDVSKIDGSKIPPVDIITFGSPCTDLSIAGKQAGLINGKQSSLFFQAIRIIREMRQSTNGKQPQYIVWENVPGAMSSNGGGDFRTVLESICRLADTAVAIPQPEKWEHAGAIVGNGYSVAWRMLDAQYWGVPQRRKRIYLVADFATERVAEILFKPESVPWNTAKSGQAWQNAPASPETGIGGNALILNDQGGSSITVSDDGVSPTIRAEMHGNVPITLSETASTLRAGAGMPKHMQDFTGRLVVEQETYRKTAHPRNASEGQGWKKTEISDTLNVFDNSEMRTPALAVQAFTQNEREEVRDLGEKAAALQASGGTHQQNYVAIPLEGNGQRPSHKGNGWSEENVAYTLNAVEQHAVAYMPTQSAQYAEGCGTLRANGGDIGNGSESIIVDKNHYTVRRLTPTECGRLQGFPDGWCDGIGIAEPTENDVAFWKKVFSTYCDLNGIKPKTDAQVRKFIQDPYSESAEYKMWGNGVALPCVYFVMNAIAEVSQ